MPNENSQPESAEKKKGEVEVRDLKPKTDAKGAARQTRTKMTSALPVERVRRTS
jgi:hypothetical protein